MARAWLDERLKVLVPAVDALAMAQKEAEVERLCLEEIASWKARPDLKESSLPPVLTAARKAIKQLPLTPENRWKNPRTGKFEHLALKYLNFSNEEWSARNAISEEKLQARLEQQQLVDHPQEIVNRAEKLLQSDAWADLVTGLALVTGRRLTEILKTGRFFPKSLYTVIFDGQLKRRDLQIVPYEIPLLLPAEVVMAAWRKLRALEDTAEMEIEDVAFKYSKEASENATRHFAGLIPQRSARENLHTHSFRAIYARIAVLWFCPVPVSDLSYVNAILGHWNVGDERRQRQFAATEHYYDYVLGDGAGQIDGRRGIRLSEPDVQVLEVFQHRKGDQSMTETTTETQEATQEAVKTKAAKTRGTLTLKPGTFAQAERLMQERGFTSGKWDHDKLAVDLMHHDAVAHQMYALLEPLAGELHTEGPVETLRALIAAYRTGGSTPEVSNLVGLMNEIADEKEPVAYLRRLVERDRKFQVALAGRHAGTDYSSLTMSELERIKTTQASTERFRRAVDAIIAHNNAQSDPLHLWYVNAAAVRDLVGGRNDAVQAYLQTRQAELEAHHKQYSLTPKQNRKPGNIADEITVE
jgi:Telomere resolvase